jgi:excisionase family DNA binding protein
VAGTLRDSTGHPMTLLTPTEYASIMRVSRATVYRWARDGIPSAKYYIKVRRSWRIKGEVLREWGRKEEEK